MWYKPFYPYVSYVKRSSTYSIPQELQQLCVYSEVYFVVRTLCLNTDTICIVGKVDSCPCPRTHQASQYTVSLKNLKIWTPQWPVSEKSLTCCDILNQHIFITVGGSLIPLFYYLYTLYIFRAFSSEIPQRQVVVTTQKKPLFLSSNKISNPRRIQLDVSPTPQTPMNF